MTQLQYRDWQHLLDEYRAALDRLREWGIRIPGGCRLDEYEKELELLAERPSFSDDAWSTAAHFSMVRFREADEVVEIVDSFPHGPGKAAKQRLQRLIKGRGHPDKEDESSKGRDTQFELYLRAVLAKGGLPAGLGSPDLQPRIDGRRLPIEAKRPKTAKRLDEHIHKAAKQVDKAGHSGVIAVSLDLILRPDFSHMRGYSHEQAQTRLRQRVVNLIDAESDRIRRRVQERDVVALLFVTRMPAREFPTGRI